jgi:transcriptional regulator with XRE-family HTH domain
MFYEALEKICTEKGRTVNSIVVSVGIPTSAITYWKKGKLPTLNTIYKLADALGVRPADLVPDTKESQVIA